jgi:hypothetical protein
LYLGLDAAFRLWRDSEKSLIEGIKIKKIDKSLYPTIKPSANSQKLPFN